MDRPILGQGGRFGRTVMGLSLQRLERAEFVAIALTVAVKGAISGMCSARTFEADRTLLALPTKLY
jgi:hypothetical protein